MGPGRPWQLFTEHAHTGTTGCTVLADGSPRTFTSYNNIERDCYNQTARISFGTIPRRKYFAAGSKSVANHIHGRVCSLDTVGMPARMRKMDSPAVILSVTADTQLIRVQVMCSENPSKARENNQKNQILSIGIYHYDIHVMCHSSG